MWQSQPQPSCFADGIYRKLSKVIAYLDIVFIAHNFLSHNLNVLSFIEAGIRVSVLLASPKSFFFRRQGVPVSRVFLAKLSALVALIFYLAELWIAFGLLSATNPDTPDVVAIQNAKSWRNFEIYLLLCEILLTFVYAIFSSNSNGKIALCWLVFRLACIFIVHSFIKEELETRAEPAIPLRSISRPTDDENAVEVVEVEDDEVIQPAITTSRIPRAITAKDNNNYKFSLEQSPSQGQHQQQQESSYRLETQQQPQLEYQQRPQLEYQQRPQLEYPQEQQLQRQSQPKVYW